MVTLMSGAARLNSEPANIIGGECGGSRQAW